MSDCQYRTLATNLSCIMWCRKTSTTGGWYSSTCWKRSLVWLSYPNRCSLRWRLLFSRYSRSADPSQRIWLFRRDVIQTASSAGVVYATVGTY